MTATDRLTRVSPTTASKDLIAFRMIWVRRRRAPENGAYVGLGAQNRLRGNVPIRG